jgi:hypothetical protein
MKKKKKEEAEIEVRLRLTLYLGILHLWIQPTLDQKDFLKSYIVGNQVQWLMSVIPATQEAEIGRLWFKASLGE